MRSNVASVRRSRKRKNGRECDLFYNNINGFKGKSTSVKQILDKTNPSIVVFCETKLANINKIKETMQQYDLIERCVKGGKGGLVIATKKNTFETCVINVTSSDNENILVGRIPSGDKGVRIIAGYAPQETDTPELREEFFEDISIEIEKSKMSSDEFLLVGDLNAKIVKDDKGNIINESSNGKLLLEVIREHNLEVLNFSDKCEGEWTHVIRTTGQASRLDYVLASGSISEQIRGMLIDETCLTCPFSLKKSKGKNVQQFSDHNSIIVGLLYQEEC